MLLRTALRARVGNSRSVGLQARNLSLWWPTKTNSVEQVATETLATATTPAAESTTQHVLENIQTITSSFDSKLGFDDPSSVELQNTLHATNLHHDQIGYLESIGLVDHWYPTDIIQQTLEYVHVYTGLPWWASIVVTTIGVRALMFPLFMKSSHTMAINQKIAPETKQLKDKMRKAMSERDQLSQQSASQELKALNKKYGIKYRNMFLPPAAMGIFSIGSFLGIRDMANLPVEAFTTQGVAWIQSLADPDPYLGLQLISGSLYAISFKLGGDSGVNQFSDSMKKILMVLPFASIIFTWNLSAGVMVYLTANGVFSIIQGRILQLPAFRKWTKMEPLPDAETLKRAKLANGGDKGVIGNFQDTWKEMQESTKVRMEKNEEAVEGTKRQLSRRSSGAIVREKKRRY